MTSTNPTVWVESLTCSFCDTSIGVAVTEQAAHWLLGPKSERPPMQVIFPEGTRVETTTGDSFRSNIETVWVECDADLRERFISGVCPTCWNKLYSDNDDD